MGGKGSGYNLPLKLTREMRMALDKLKVQFETADDFPVALRVFRLGELLYGVLSPDDLQAMYRRRLITDDEAQFLLEHGFVDDDFRPVTKERIHQAEAIKVLNQQFGSVLQYWDGLQVSAKLHWAKEATKHPDLPNARRVSELVKEAAS